MGVFGTRQSQPPYSRLAADLEAWYGRNGRQFPWRKGEMDPWQVLVTEILLQQTSASRVSGFLGPFFSIHATPQTLAEAPLDTLRRQLAPLGLQDRRARSIRSLMRKLEDRDWIIPRSQGDLLALPGVGPYVAAAYRANVFGDVVVAVDTNVARIVERLFGPRQRADIRWDPHINGVAGQLASAAANPRVLNWALLDFGALICRPRAPKCRQCPASSYCPTLASAE